MDFSSYGVFLFQNLIYLILTSKMLKHYGFSFKTSSSDKNNLKYNWIRFLIIGSFVIWIAKLQSFSLWYLSRSSKWCPYTATTYLLVLFLFITSIVYISLKKPISFLFNKKYLKSGLSERNKKKIKEQLLKYMNEEKIYLDQNLRLETLAKKLSVKREHLSQIINEMFNLNFYDFVNKYRVEEFINCLKDKKNGHKTLLYIALECGFNTKATFNAAFKKSTGVTPKQFRKSLHLKK
jgi:AraC-like DNA-binding protein